MRPMPTGIICLHNPGTDVLVRPVMDDIWVENINEFLDKSRRDEPSNNYIFASYQGGYSGPSA